MSLCFRSLTDYINNDNIQGLQSFLENKQVQIDDKDEVAGITGMNRNVCATSLFFRMGPPHLWWQPPKEDLHMFGNC